MLVGCLHFCHIDKLQDLLSMHTSMNFSMYVMNNNSDSGEIQCGRCIHTVRQPLRILVLLTCHKAYFI